MPPVSGAALTAALFFTGAIAMTGLPPLSGFVGKLLILDAAFTSPLMAWTWVIVLSSSLIGVVGFARAGSTVFWKSTSVEHPEPESRAARPNGLSYVAVGGLLSLLIAHTVFAGQVHKYMAEMATQLFNPDRYVSTVLETPGKLSDGKAEAH